ncbi:MerR family transcriptional regulator [Aeromicrobium sp.]|uniref:MerR family transcriptional regulator n=1 Tax=Aeromicrobium sp. TaxID=1871063 RepID=UPI0025C6C637|nr:MerR family transcriptional regulator [Aeromicrobium sp.]MCK5890802.1 MerR family transcriptional regulator [Aeromicrobium sp.]
MPNHPRTIAAAAAELGVSVDTLRYYERDGLLLRAVPRGGNGHRTYTDVDLGWIELVTRLRSTGMPIRDIRRYAELVRAGSGNETERLAVLTAHRDEVVRQLEEVSAHLVAIETKIATYHARLRPREKSA